MARWFIAGVLLLSALPARAADWKVITISDSGTVVYADVNSARQLPPVPINRPFSVIQLWLKFDHSKDKSERDRQAVKLYRVHCDAETMAVVSSTSYSANGNVSDSWSSGDDSDFRYKPAIPDTVGYSIMEFACGRASVIGER